MVSDSCSRIGPDEKKLKGKWDVPFGVIKLNLGLFIFILIFNTLFSHIPLMYLFYILPLFKK